MIQALVQIILFECFMFMGVEFSSKSISIYNGVHENFCELFITIKNIVEKNNRTKTEKKKKNLNLFNFPNFILQYSIPLEKNNVT